MTSLSSTPPTLDFDSSPDEVIDTTSTITFDLSQVIADPAGGLNPFLVDLPSTEINGPEDTGVFASLNFDFTGLGNLVTYSSLTLDASRVVDADPVVRGQFALTSTSAVEFGFRWGPDAEPDGQFDNVANLRIVFTPGTGPAQGPSVVIEGVDGAGVNAGGEMSEALVEALLDALQFGYSGSVQQSLSGSFTATVTDGNGLVSNAVSFIVDIVGQNTPPTLDFDSSPNEVIDTTSTITFDLSQVIADPAGGLNPFLVDLPSTEINGPEDTGVFASLNFDFTGMGNLVTYSSLTLDASRVVDADPVVRGQFALTSTSAVEFGFRWGPDAEPDGQFDNVANLRIVFTPGTGPEQGPSVVIEGVDGAGVNANGEMSEALVEALLDALQFGYSGSVQQSLSGSFTATVTDGNGLVSNAVSFIVDIVGQNKAPTGSVTISGDATQGITLTASNTLADADGLGDITYTWQADGETVATGTSTYTLTQADVGKTITVTASYTDDAGTTESVTSDPTDAVANVNDAPTGTVTITGVAAQGQTLTASNNLADVDGLGEISYVWKADGETVSSGTDEYTLTQADVGKVITVIASYTDGQGTEESVSSSATAPVYPATLGTSGNDSLLGSAGNDWLNGLEGDDTLNGAGGNDTLQGGAGADRFIVTSGTDTIVDLGFGGQDMFTVSAGATVNATVVEDWTASPGNTNAGTANLTTHGFNVNLAAVTTGLGFSVTNTSEAGVSLTGSGLADSLTGGIGADTLIGGAGNDVIIGLAGDDLLDGGTGIDSLIGGDGNDTYVVNTSADVVVEGADGGIDQVEVGFTVGGTYTLTANVENATVTSAATVAVHLVGNALDNALTGNAAANSLTGGDGNDTLDGGLGSDTMAGGDGDDVYYVNVISDVVNESAAGSGGNDTVNVALAVAGTYVMSAGVENARITNGTVGVSITGNSSNNQITGNGEANLLSGGAGDDTLDGGAGNDTLDGGLGNDEVVLGGDVSEWNATRLSATETRLVRQGDGQTVILRGVEVVRFEGGAISLNALFSQASEFADLLTGTSGDDTLEGLAGNDTIMGLAGNDLIDGGAGSDSLVGGAGNDIYLLDVATDQVVEAAEEGTDEVRLGFSTGATYTLTANVENATVTSAATVAVHLVGNALDNALTGNAAANSLTGGDGNDTLDGGLGSDTMAGGDGDDVYYVNVISDVVNESAAESGGNDTVNVALAAAGTYVMSAGVENALISNQTAGVSITGNAGNNAITGNNAANLLSGGDGNDTLTALLGNDTLDGGAGNDEVVLVGLFADWNVSRPTATTTILTREIGAGPEATTQSVTLRGVELVRFEDQSKRVETLLAGASAFADLLTGSENDDSIDGLAGNDTIEGLEGNDLLNGGADSDSMIGGDGNDTYVVDRVTDVVVEAPGQGIDEVLVGLLTAGTYVLTANVENATLTSAATIAAHLTGNELDNLLIGSAAANSLVGGAGNDTLDGGIGSDTLIGGAGDDTYVVNVTTDVVNETALGSNGIDTIHVALTAAGTYVMSAGVEKALIIDPLGGASIAGVNIVGNADHNEISGSAAANLLSGGDGNDTLTGGLGNDTLDGGAGHDKVVLGGNFSDWVVSRPTASSTLLTRVIGSGPEQVTQSVTLRDVEQIQFDDGLRGLDVLWDKPSSFADVLTGTSGNDTISSLAGNDTVTGLDGDDFLDGGAGVDSLIGGDGNDTYVVDVISDVVVEAANEGTDLVNVALTVAGTYVLSAHVENATVTAAAAISANVTGNDLNNILIGNAAANVLIGGGGNDTIDGGAGSDTMIGGAGDDTYTINVTTDVINETASGSNGIDTVNIALSAAGTYTMAAGVEHAIVTNEVAGVNVTGNASDNTLTGNGQANLLSGGVGNDTLDGGGGNDTLDGGLGIDKVILDGGVWTVSRPNATDTVLTSGSRSVTLRGVELVDFGGEVKGIDELWSEPSPYADVLTGTPGDDSLNSAEGNDTIYGLGGNDTLNGGTGSDSLVGGEGDDTYLVDVASDIVIEAANQGIDQVNVGFTAAGTYTLAANVENATVTAAATIAVNITGNELDNVLTGNAAANVLSGGAGNDTLDGGAGSDNLIGGAGDDLYRINIVTDVVNETAPGSSGNDTVEIALAVAGTYLMTAGVENAVITNATAGVNITGSADNNHITGNAQANLLVGGAGNDTLVSGGGNDTLDGGAGNDEIVLDGLVDDWEVSRPNATDTLLTRGSRVITMRGVELVIFDDGSKDLSALWGTPTAFADVLKGTAGNDSLSGLAGNDTLIGLAGDDTLDGGTGTDSLVGGDGNDVYVVDVATDVVVEAAGIGIDQVNVAFTAAGTYVLTANVENATVTAAATIAVNITGNDLDNLLTGNAAANVLTGGGGNDTIDGGAGTDTMIGGAGDDTYTINVTTDVINETAAGSSGNDTVNVALAVAGTYVMTAGVENAVISNGTAGVNITGSADNNQITGNSQANLLNGGAGNDTLDGGGGNDTLDGGLGIDEVVLEGNFNEWSVSLRTATDTVLTRDVRSVTLRGVELINFDNGPQDMAAFWTESSLFADALTGTTGDDTLLGFAGNDTITGLSGNDMLDGGTGIDSLVGGDGNDSYVVDVANDVVVEAADEGIDHVSVGFTVAGTYVLSANVENATVTAAATIAANITGNELDNILTGNAAANILTGGAGNDFLAGGLGNDSLIGGAGNDTLDGGVGTDSMTGGAGDDVYTINVITDIINETAIGSGGTDTVNVALALAGTYVMANGVENAVISNSTLGVNITGNAANNEITGNDQANLLNGGAGNDTLDGGGGNDTLDGGLGTDEVVLEGDFSEWSVSRPTAADTVLTRGSRSVTLRGIEKITFADGTQDLVALWTTASAFADLLTGTTGDDTLSGLAGNDTITGLAGNDLLDGGAGIDSLVGGDGNDSYVVDVATDIVVELADEGIDHVSVAFTAAGTYVLTANVENATVTAAAAIAANITGNALDNVLIGNAAANILIGGAGNDTLDGGAGTDTDSMVGGDGDDVYTINVITDIINETAIGSGGTDTVNVALALAGTYVMANGVENAVISNGTLGVNITGNAGNNEITGNDQANLLSGGAGDDLLTGGAGNDTLDGGLGNDIVVLDGTFSEWTPLRTTAIDTVLTRAGQSVTLRGVEVVLFADGPQEMAALWTTPSAFADALTGTFGDDSINGLAGNDTISALWGNDTLNGGVGIDSLIGGDGDDTYFIDVITDVIVEAVDEGIDLVNVGLTVAGTYLLAANVENATVTAAASIAVNITGNALDNVLIGNAAANILIGGAGNDTIDGGAGTDTMIGGAGDDTYTINVTTDIINETAIGSGGIDTVNVALALAGTYVMATGVENAVISNSTAGVNITGNAGNNEITGNATSNQLNGGAGDDTLTGGEGNDTLTGGAGSDVIDLTELSAGADIVAFAGGVGTAGSLARVTSLGLDVVTGLDLGTDTTSVDLLRFSAADFGIAAGVAVRGGGNLDGNFYVVSGAPTGTAVDLNGTAANVNGAIVFVGSAEIEGGVDVYYTTNEGAFSTANSVQIATLMGISTANLNAGDLSFVA